MEREVALPPERGPERGGGPGGQQARQVLDGQDVGARLDYLLGEPEVVIQRVQALVGVRQVRGVAQGHLGDRRTRLAYGIDGGAHLADVVEGVEDAEDVDA